MNFSSLVDSGVGSELERFILNHATLEPGDKLEGKVIEVKPNGRLLIHFGSFRALADAQFPIKEGEIINVVVVSKQPKLKLRLETPGLKSIDPTSIIQKMEMIPEDKWQNVRSVLQKILNIEKPEEVLFPDELRDALGTIDDRAKLKNPAPDRVSLLLAMELLGGIRVDFHQKGSDLNITFYVKSPRIKEKMEQYLPQIRQRLEKRFKYLVLHVIVSEKKISEFDSEELDEVETAIKMLDLQA
jgi:hypothetical protein